MPKQHSLCETNFARVLRVAKMEYFANVEAPMLHRDAFGKLHTHTAKGLKCEVSHGPQTRRSESEQQQIDVMNRSNEKQEI
jgi:hypothetical protein